jgi:hypothetical protein
MMEIVSYTIIDFVDCKIPAVFAVGMMGAVEKLDDRSGPFPVETFSFFLFLFFFLLFF